MTKQELQLKDGDSVNVVDSGSGQSTTGVVETAPAPVDNEAPEKRSIRDRIKDIETRYGKSFEEVLIDMHDHIFGKSDEPVPEEPVPATAAPVGGLVPQGGDPDETDYENEPEVVVTGRKRK